MELLRDQLTATRNLTDDGKMEIHVIMQIEEQAARYEWYNGDLHIWRGSDRCPRHAD